MPNNKKSLFLWIISGILGLLIFILFFNHTFPAASINLKLSRKEVFQKAEGFVLSQGYDLDGFDRAIIFDSSYHASAYLQKNLGIRKSNELIGEGIPVWYWRLRWFKELEKEGFSLLVDPSSGELVHFHHAILEDTQGANLSERKAARIAREVIALQGIDLNEYTLKDKTTKKRKKRTDHYFSWEKKDYKVEDATLRLSVEIYGEKLGKYSRYLKVPEEFIRDLDKETSLGNVLSMISSIFFFLLMIAAIATLIIQHKSNKVNWKFGLVTGCIVTLLSIAAFLNNAPLIWIFYRDTISKAVFITTSVGGIILAALLAGLSILLFGSSGESLSRDLWRTNMPLFKALRNKISSPSQLAPPIVVGYSLGFLFLGYVTIFYLVGTKFFNIWMPPDSEYSNILATAMPFLFPLTIALSAAISEEFMFRLFAISFIKRYMRFTWLAVLFSALIWAFAHSSYPVFPNYVRGIELTIFGVALGLVFLKYGIEAVLIAHFVIDASLVGLPLLKSGNPYFVASGIVVICLAFIPIPVMIVIFKNKK